MNRAQKDFEEMKAQRNGTKKKAPPELISAADLLAKEFPEPRFAVEGIIPEGVTLLGSKPKVGKTWMMLGLGVAVASGGYAFGKKEVEQGSVLALFLEDNLRRVQSRLKKILQEGEAPEKLDITTEWPRLDEGGVEAIEAWLEAHQDARLVIIDTLAKARKPARGNNVYQEDYSALERLLPVASKHRVSIVVVTHLRKMEADDPIDEINSSTGLTAGVDGILVLKRQRGKSGAFLHVTGRDIEEERELALSWDHTTAAWILEGNADEVRVSTARAEIIKVLEKHDRLLSPKEIAALLGKAQNSVYQLVYQMSCDGQIKSPDRGLYTHLNHKDNKDDKDNKENKDGSSLFEDPGSNKDRNKEGSSIDKGNSVGNDQNLIGLIDLSGNEGHKNDLTPEQQARITKRISEGMSPELARAAVLDDEAGVI